jgi:hypothetical protein
LLGEAGTALCLNRQTASQQATASWNFPSSPAGRIKMSFVLESEGDAVIALSDHSSAGWDRRDDPLVSLFALTINSSQVGSHITKLNQGQWYQLQMDWTIAEEAVSGAMQWSVSVDDASVAHGMENLMRTGNEGRVSYWSLQSLNPGGVCVGWIHASSHDRSLKSDDKEGDVAAAARTRAINHENVMRLRDISMRAKQADAHRAAAGAASLGLGNAVTPSQLRSRYMRGGPPQSAPGIVDAASFADPTGATDAAPGLRKAIAELLAGSALSGRFSLWSNVTDLSGRRLELGGGEYLLQSALSIPGGFGNFELRGGTLRAGSLFPADKSLLSLGDDSGSHIESVSLTSMLLHGGGGLARGSLLNITYGVGISVGPAVYFEGFSGVGAQINRGAEILIHECWFVGQYGSGLPFYSKPPAQPPSITLFNSTAIQINGNDHYVSDVVIWQYTRLGVQVNGGGNLLSGVHAWGCGAAWCDRDWYQDLGLNSKSLTGIEINAPRNRVVQVRG